DAAVGSATPFSTGQRISFGTSSCRTSSGEVKSHAHLELAHCKIKHRNQLRHCPRDAQRDCSQMAVECEGASQAILVTLLAGDTVEIPSQCSNRESDDRRSGATSLENDCSSRLP